MATIQLPPDFKEFLRLLNSNDVEHLIVARYAANYYGFSRATADLDIWIAIDPANAERLAEVLREFGFPNTQATTFLAPGKVIRMGGPPVRLEILTSISGVSFEECYSRRLIAELDGIQANVIDLGDLKANKAASGRLKDRLDLQELPWRVTTPAGAAAASSRSLKPN